MKDVTNRYYKVYMYLLENKKVKNNRDLAKKTGTSVSFFTELSKKRTNVGLETLQKTVQVFPYINSNWILIEQGEMILPEVAPGGVVAEDGVAYTLQVDLIALKTERQMLIKSVQNLNELIDKLKAENARLKAKIESKKLK